jgi:putative transposase
MTYRLWLTLAEIADLQLAGMPTTARGMLDLAEREAWAKASPLVRQREGKGGGFEYHIEQLPTWARLDYVRRQSDVLISVGEDSLPFIEDDGELSQQARTNRDARLALLAAAERYGRDTGLGQNAADHLFASLYNGCDDAQLLAKVTPEARARLEKLSCPAWVRMTVRSLSARTLARWRADIKEEDANALAVDRALARKGSGVLDRAGNGEIRDYVLALISKNPHFNAEHLRNAVIGKYCSNHRQPELALPDGRIVDFPSLRNFQRVVKAWKDKYRNELMKIADPDKYRSSVEFVQTGTSAASRLNELWQIDASPLDAITTTRGTRPTIYACVDIFSRRVEILVTDTPRAVAVGLLLRKAILAWGVPEKVKSDNGTDFTAHYIARLFANLGIQHLKSAPYEPRSKGPVERIIGTFQRQFVTRLPGFVGHNPADRKVLENRKSFAKRLGLDDAHMFGAELTDDQVAEMADHWAQVEYAHRAHSGRTMRGRTPFEVASSYRGEVRRIENPHALDLLLAPVAGKDGFRTVTHQGIQVGKAGYHLGTLLVGDKVFCRQDPRDMGRLYVFGADQETFLGVAENWQLLGLDPVENAARVRALQKAVTDKAVEPIRKMARKIGPMDVANAQRAAGQAKKGNLVAFPQPTAKFETEALRAAMKAVTPDAPRQADARTIAEQKRLAAKKAAPVAQLPESPEQRYRRALSTAARIDASQPVEPREAEWLAGYRNSSEFKGLARLAARKDRASEA